MRFLCVALALSVAACSSLGSNGGVPVGSIADVVHASTDACKGACIGKCRGTNDSTITPCPITLTGKDGRKGIDVTVSAPGITWAQPVPKHGRHRYDACQVGKDGDHDWICHLRPVGGRFVTTWRVSSGTNCGKINVLFKAYSGEILIANVYLPITNKYCP
jgi:hypothetical protein